jgi:hypothetical protein
VVRFTSLFLFSLILLTSPLIARQPHLQQGNTASDIGQGLSSFLRGYQAARAQRDSELLAIAPDLIAFGSQPDSIRAQGLSRLLPVQLQALLGASQKIQRRFALRSEQAVALQRLDTDISRLLSQ